MELNHITIDKTARYFTLGGESDTIDNIWFVLHGYSHLAEHFIKSFEVLNNGNTAIVAPEGLHRFYLEGMSGKIGASWMTKEDRLNDISDYVNYLDKVYEGVLDKVSNKDAVVNLLGFSQGTATACRWLCRGKIKAQNLVLWAGAVPDDLDFDSDSSLLSGLKMKIVLGRQDEFITAKHITTHLLFLREKGIQYEVIEYDGTHKIDLKTLIEISEGL